MVLGRRLPQRGNQSNPRGLNNDSLSIGVDKRSNGGHDKHCDGKLDDLRIYNRALSANEVQQLHLTESPDSDGDGLSDAYERAWGVTS